MYLCIMNLKMVTFVDSENLLLGIYSKDVEM